MCLTSFLALSIAYKDDYHSIELPIKSSKYDLQIIKTPSEEKEHVTYVDVPGGQLPVYITFKTQSSPVNVKQEHRGTKGSVQKSDSKDEPHKLIHEVIKPIYQEIKEIIQPYRKVVQVIEPVKEERYTKVHKSERKTKYEGNGGYGDKSGYGSNSGGYDHNSGDEYGAHRVGIIGTKYGVSNGYGYDNTDDSNKLLKISKTAAKYGIVSGVSDGDGYGGNSGGYGEDSDNSYEIKSAGNIGGGYGPHRVGNIGNKYGVSKGDGYGYDNTNDGHKLLKASKTGANYGIVSVVNDGNGYVGKSGGYGDNSDSSYEIKSAGNGVQKVGKTGSKYAVLSGDGYGVNSESGYGKKGDDQKYLRLDQYFKSYGPLEDKIESLKTYVD